MKHEVLLVAKPLELTLAILRLHFGNLTRKDGAKHICGFAIGNKQAFNEIDAKGIFLTENPVLLKAVFMRVWRR